MVRVICDHCAKEVAPNDYGLAPDGWISIRTQGVYKASPDYCSKACAIAALAAPPPVTDVERTIEDSERSARVGEALDALDVTRAADMAAGF